MSERNRFSVDELKKIGWRIKSIRSLTGLNQEEFSLKSDIPHMTLKGWELGRALPRQDGIRRILLGLDVYGIQVTSEWIVFGEGNGPVYGTKNTSCDKKEYPGLELTIEAFKNEQRKKANNPIVIQIDDLSMSPRFNIGDIIGGMIINIGEIKEKYSLSEISACSWLIPIGHNEWIVRDIYFSGKRIYIKQANNPDLVESNIVSIGKIIWHYFDGEQT